MTEFVFRGEVVFIPLLLLHGLITCTRAAARKLVWRTTLTVAMKTPVIWRTARPRLGVCRQVSVVKRVRGWRTVGQPEIVLACMLRSFTVPTLQTPVITPVIHS